ncbi:MAG: DUF1667 domain-containing protein [Candidatus Omnitrophica bacterium]|nr:DUF1667 domain-containing protein [Candidatus Omnitrophota bacterium]
MIRKLTCIECPAGCALLVEVESGKVVGITGNNCPKGEKYAITEVESPVRVLTSTVLTEGLPLKTIPVRTDAPIPKASLFKAMEEIRKIRIKKPLHVGNVITKNLAGSGANLIATRECLADQGSATQTI